MTPDDFVRAAHTAAPDALSTLAHGASTEMQHAVAAATQLYAANPRHDPTTDWATAVGSVRDHVPAVALDRRVREVVEVQDWDRLVRALHTLLSRVCAPQGVALDYVGLAEELAQWQRAAAPVRREWRLRYGRSAFGKITGSGAVSENHH